MQGLEDSVVIVLHDSPEHLQNAVPAIADHPRATTGDTTAAESKRRRFREMPQHMRSNIDGSGRSSSAASVSGRGPRAHSPWNSIPITPVNFRNSEPAFYKLS